MNSGAKQGRFFNHNRFHLAVVIATTSFGALAEDLFKPAIEPAERNSAQAGYLVESHLEVVSCTKIYTWTVHNVDQTWGLDGFSVEVPAQTRILSSSVPAPYANPDSTAYWILQEKSDGWVDPHDQRLIVPNPRPGMKLLFWWGQESPSVYPPGSTVSFSVATRASEPAGLVNASASTYTPQNYPHYYVPWLGQVLGPVAQSQGPMAPELAAKDPRSSFQPVPTGPVVFPEIHSSASVPSIDSVSVAMSLHPALTIRGTVGAQYGIQCTTDLANLSSWHGVTNLILQAATQVWFDPEPSTGPERFYRVVPGPIAVP